MYIGQALFFFSENATIMKISVFKTLLRNQQEKYETSQKAVVLVPGCKSVECLPQRMHLCGVLVPGSVMEPDSHTKSKREPRGISL